MKEILKRLPREGAQRAASVPDNLWVRCPRCKELQYTKEHEQSLKVCSKCKYHWPLTARERIDATLDAGTFREIDAGMHSSDPLHFSSRGEVYGDKLEQYARQTGAAESFIYGTGAVDGQSLVFGVTEFGFAGGSMGAVFGEKLTRAIELARRELLPLVVVSSGGGARMQEGTISLLQMAKTVAALDRFKAAGLPFLSVMADPCLGGMTASYAILGDVNIAEPGAYIGFAGRRVIEQTMRQKLPQNAARAEFLLEHGMIDIVVARAELPSLLGRLVRLLATSNPAVARRRGRVEQHAGV
ncbi:MAG TPA: acetyl-CoA carboxylase, carboxyltransferase subunit beta [Chloroflexota bacterium]|nr:acetyl-CoA carboxylase, carboxyltransferase subunit beta [Chloroflexota bacterium]